MLTFLAIVMAFVATVLTLVAALLMVFNPNRHDDTVGNLFVVGCILYVIAVIAAWAGAVVG